MLAEGLNQQNNNVNALFIHRVERSNIWLYVCSMRSVVTEFTTKTPMTYLSFGASQPKFLSTDVGKQLWQAINARQKQTATVCNDVKQIFKHSLEFVGNKTTDVCQHYIFSTFPNPVKKSITGILLGWDSNPRPL